VKTKTINKNPLTIIPGIGKSLAQDLNSLGIREVEDLKTKNPEILYDDLCKLQNANIDRCVLYTFRCAVYYARSNRHDPELLKWWNWKEKELKPKKKLKQNLLSNN
jgi:hypothetical protein